ncbi:MAG: dimethyl sulfoxide reductase anchor subunit [Pseudomonadales bacterium]|nr:dimethyl sulfoxide reductase anchor subunit [Pseudomonadales bacterium]
MAAANKPSDSLAGSVDKPSLWDVRTEEQEYAFLPDVDIQDDNLYGQKIDLIELTRQSAPVGRAININGNETVGDNKNRNKQHGFYFTADNCIGCHACESACAEKNDTPSHLAFRSVGYVEGGSYPDYLRLNISMACNHCDDPVCLKGCPTGAYTKLAEYGAVLQDPDTCFGCGYCTWVCPYNAPQLDPVKGEVSKCNMCVDRLEVGLKPACVSACLGNALDFGVIENVPDKRFQAETSIPGFPDPSITHPNIRFQQVTQLPDEMQRTDSAPVKYQKVADGAFKPAIDKKQGTKKSWNLGRLNSHENPLVIFTLATQASIGAFVIAFLSVQFELPGFLSFAESWLYPALMLVAFLFVSLGLFMSTMHLGKPLRFYRGFNNLRYSPVCREGLGIAVYMAMLGLHLLCSGLINADIQALMSWAGISIAGYVNTQLLAQLAAIFGLLAIPSALLGLYYMNRCYRIKARPFWDHWQVVTSFFGNTASLGAMLAGLMVLPTVLDSPVQLTAMLLMTGTLLVVGLLSEALGLFFHRRDLYQADNEGGVAFYIQTSTFGKTYDLRNCLLALAVILGVVGIYRLNHDLLDGALLIGFVVALMGLVSSVIGRALFYILVVPTTMPGAFFWKNKGFEQHARDIGLADLPQAGVAPNGH